MSTKTANQFATTLLLINGLAACVGGALCIIDPSGKLAGFSTATLVFLPFRSYLLPGIALLMLNGFGSLLIAFLLKKQYRYASALVVLQGIVSLLWIIIQAMTIPQGFLQYAFGTVAVGLIIVGLLMHPFQRSTILN